jgi:L-aspartate semialdehyde sulfurtransferase
MKTIDEINDKISNKQAVVWTVDEVKSKVGELGIAKIAELVDVITTGSFEPMESSGAILASVQ